MTTHSQQTTDRVSTLRELAERIDLAKRRADWRAVELHTAAWHRLNGQTASAAAVAGLARRQAREAARDYAAAVAPLPLTERVGRTQS